MKRNIGVSILCAIALLGILYVGYDQFFAFRPFLRFNHTHVDLKEDYNFETVYMMSAYDPKRYTPKTFLDSEQAFNHWNKDIFDELYYEYTSPTDVKLTAELDHTKVTFTYKGYVTTQEGETIDYFEEASFDFKTIPNIDNFD